MAGRSVSDNGDEADRRFELLKLDYEIGREDERVLTNTVTTMFGIAVALIAILLPLVSQTCGLAGDPSSTNCINIPLWIVAITPLGPFALVAYLAGLGTSATIRSYYLRAVEQELQGYGGADMAAVALPPASFISLSVAVGSLRRGRRGSRLLVVVMFLAVLVVFGAIIGYIVLRLPPPYRWIAAATYTTGVVVMIAEVMRASVGGRGLFARAIWSYRRYRSNVPDVSRLADLHERSIAGYVLLPRPQDMIKWIFLPAAFVVGSWAVGAGWADLVAQAVDAWTQLRHAAFWLDPVASAQLMTLPVVRLVFVFVIVEYLLFEARYQWNDIRGLAEDLAHPVPKRRLPVGLDAEHARRNVRISAWTALARIGVALAVAAALGAGLLRMTAALSVVIFGVAVLYELLRSRKPPPGAEFRTGTVTIQIWIAVGVGYAIRGVAGFLVAGVPATGWVIAAAAVMLLTFGVVFVTLTWVLDASSYCYSDPATGHVDFARALLDKPHLAALLPYVGAIRGSAVAGAAGSGPTAGAQATPLRRRGRVLAPWNLAMVLTGGAAGAAGFGFAAGRAAPGPLDIASSATGPGWLTSSSSAPVTAAASIGLAGAIALMLASRSWQRCLAGLALVLGAAVWLWPALGPRTILAVLPWAVVSGWYIWFRHQSFTSLKAGLKPVIQVARRAAWGLAVVVAGRRTARLLLDLKEHDAAEERLAGGRPR